MSEQKIIIGAIVNNRYGVLMRITELFTKRCYNIDSLEVGVTDDPAFSRMTIVATGDVYVEEQIIKQLSKLHDVKHAAIIPADRATVREHMLLKLNATTDTHNDLISIITTHGARVIDFSPSTTTIELTGKVVDNDTFIETVRPLGIMEVCRAGAQALHRGAECL